MFEWFFFDKVKLQNHIGWVIKYWLHNGCLRLQECAELKFHLDSSCWFYIHKIRCTIAPSLRIKVLMWQRHSQSNYADESCV